MDTRLTCICYRNKNSPNALLLKHTRLVAGPPGLAKRVIACLDVRANDQGDLVVTKGDQYDVREDSSDG